MAPAVVKVRVPLIDEVMMIEPPRPIMAGTAYRSVRKCAAQIDGEGLVPVFRRQFMDRSPDAVDAGIGHDDVDGPELVAGSPAGVLNVGGVRDVGRQGDGAAAEPLDLRRYRLDLFGRPAEHCHVGTGGGEPKRRCPADARAGAGDERDLSREFHAVFLSDAVRFQGASIQIAADQGESSRPAGVTAASPVVAKGGDASISIDPARGEGFMARARVPVA